MRDYTSIGSVPCNEECQQVPYSDYGLMLRECKQYIEAIRKDVKGNIWLFRMRTNGVERKAA